MIHLLFGTLALLFTQFIYKSGLLEYKWDSRLSIYFVYIEI